jgi:DNA-binding CsgD family transcriptional regulator
MSPKLRQVQELLSRNLTADEIAHRLHLTVSYVTSAIQILKQKKLDCR